MISFAHRKIEKDARVLLGIHALSSIIRIFSRVFLTIYFLKATQWNIGMIAIFYIIQFFTQTIVFYRLGNQVKCKNRMIPFRLSIIFYFTFLLLIIFLKDKVSIYIPYLAVLYGIAAGFYWLPYNVLLFDLNPSASRSLYFSYEKIMIDILSVIVPFFAGTIIDRFNSYDIIMVTVLIFMGLSFISSFAISIHVEGSNTSFSIKNFLSSLKTNSNTNVYTAYKGEFLRGLSYFAGALDIVVVVIIYMVFSTEFALGALTSLFTTIAILTSLFVGKFLNDKYFKLSIIISSIVLCLGTILLVFNVSNYSIITYNIVFSIAVSIMSILQSVYSYKVIDTDGLQEYRIEHIVVREAILNFARIISFLFLLIITKFGNNFNSLRIVLIILSLSILLISFNIRKFKVE